MVMGRIKKRSQTGRLPSQHPTSPGASLANLHRQTPLRRLSGAPDRSAHSTHQSKHLIQKIKAEGPTFANVLQPYPRARPEATTPGLVKLARARRECASQRGLSPSIAATNHVLGLGRWACAIPRQCMGARERTVAPNDARIVNGMALLSYCSDQDRDEGASLSRTIAPTRR